MDKYTDKVQEILNESITLAYRNSNSEISVWHLLHSALSVSGTLIGRIFSELDIDSLKLLGAVKTKVTGLPTVSNHADPRLSSQSNTLLRLASSIAKELGDEYVSAEHLWLAFFEVSDTKELLSQFGLTKTKSESIIKTIGQSYKIVFVGTDMDYQRFINKMEVWCNKPIVILNDMRKTLGVLNNASFIIANDTGPAHMAAHLGVSGVVLFGYHTTPKKVSIETDKFKAISVNDLSNLTVEKVYSEIKEKIELIN